MTNFDLAIRQRWSVEMITELETIHDKAVMLLEPYPPVVVEDADADALTHETEMRLLAWTMNSTETKSPWIDFDLKVLLMRAWSDPAWDRNNKSYIKDVVFAHRPAIEDLWNSLDNERKYMTTPTWPAYSDAGRNDWWDAMSPAARIAYYTPTAGRTDGNIFKSVERTLRARGEFTTEFHDEICELVLARKAKNDAYLRTNVEDLEDMERNGHGDAGIR